MSEVWNGLLRLLGGTLAFLYGLIPNFGIAIILLTVIISTLLFPLTLKQTRSMRQMQEIQPQVKSLQAKFKGDRERLNQELMALYKERGVNPAAGCLPLLLQAPIWIALFRVLRAPATFNEAGDLVQSYVGTTSALLADLHHAAVSGSDAAFRFIGLNLLETPGEAMSVGFMAAVPYLLLLILLVVTGYYQQAQMTRRRVAGNPAGEPVKQPRAMKAMPLLFGLFGWRFPAGLSMYFVVSQLSRIGQQVMVFRMDGRTLQAAPQPAPEEPAPPRAKPPQPGSRKRRRKRRK